MRLRHLVIATCCVVVQLAAPAPAQAWWEWLDQLSGPGPFTGWDVQWRLKCIADTRPTVEVLALDNLKSPFWHEVARALGAGCAFESSVNPLASVNFAVGRMYAIENNLEYDASVPKDKRGVRMTKFEPSLSVFVDAKKFVEITSGLGVMMVSGPAFNRFHHYYWAPLRVTITPGNKALSVRLGFMIMPEGFDAIDFGAKPGTFHTDREVLGTASLSVDLSRLGKNRPSR
jgi:hypothetical protein